MAKDLEELQLEHARLKKELEEAQYNLEMLDEVIERVPDGVYLTDGDANAIRINAAFERISGLRREDLLGRNHRDLEKEGIIRSSRFRSRPSSSASCRTGNWSAWAAPSRFGSTSA